MARIRIPKAMIVAVPLGIISFVMMSGASPASLKQAQNNCPEGSACYQQKVAQANQAAATYCAQNTPIFDDISAWAHANRKGNPDTPDPPEAFPPCASCDKSDAANPADAGVDDWVTKSLDPEASKATTIAGIAGEALRAIKVPELTSANRKCLAHLIDGGTGSGAGGYRQIINNLMSSLWNKALEMGKQHKSEPKKAYAGLKFLLAASKAYDLSYCASFNTVSNEILCDAAGQAEGDIPIARAWYQSLEDKVEKDAASGHLYNLCPSYWGIARQLQLLESEAIPVDEMQKIQKKLEDSLHFKLQMNFAFTGQAKGGGFSVNLTGTANVHFQLDPQKPCFTPMVDGNAVKMQVTNYTLSGSDFVGPRSFSLPVDYIIVTMCDTTSPPMFIIHFKDPPPLETVTAQGHQATTSLLRSTFGLALAEPVLDKFGKTATNAKVDTSATKGVATSGSSDAMNKVKAQMDAHKGDPSWFMSAEGQAAIRQMQAEALSTAYGPSVKTEMANGGNGNPTLSLRLDWTNGSGTPVDAKLNTKLSDQTGAVGTSTLKVTLTQQSQ